MSSPLGRLKNFGWFVLFAMLAVTTWASLEKGVMWGFEWLMSERWGWATLFDAYFGFMFFYLWILSREDGWVSRGAWFVALLVFGNIAMAIYLLRAVYKLPPDASIKHLLKASH